MNPSPRLECRNVVNSAARNAGGSDPCGMILTCSSLFERGWQPQVDSRQNALTSRQRKPAQAILQPMNMSCVGRRIRVRLTGCFNATTEDSSAGTPKYPGLPTYRVSDLKTWCAADMHYPAAWRKLVEHLHQDGCRRGRGLARGGIVWEDRTGVVAHGAWSEHENKNGSVVCATRTRHRHRSQSSITVWV